MAFYSNSLQNEILYECQFLTKVYSCNYYVLPPYRLEVKFYHFIPTIHKHHFSEGGQGHYSADISTQTHTEHGKT